MQLHLTCFSPAESSILLPLLFPVFFVSEDTREKRNENKKPKVERDREEN